tara:strand:+ start:3028 stop:4092 length:1065 start_codon:yes stop_codon:yes gene_type:complete
MKISSLFKDKAYVFADDQDSKTQNRFALEVLSAVRPRFDITSVALLEICDDYDIFLLRERKRGTLKLKISLSDPDGTLQSEAVGLRSTTGACTPHLIDMGDLKMGEQIKYSLTYVGEGESARNMGRGPIVSLAPTLFESYFTIVNSRSVKKKYKQILDLIVAGWDVEKKLPPENLCAFQEYTNYKDAKKFLDTLGKETLATFSAWGDLPPLKCHGNISLDSIFCDGANFYFDSLSKISMGHPLVDFVDFILDAAVSQRKERQLLNEFCEQGKLEKDKGLYDKIYMTILRKKLGELVIGYIREIYLYDSYRYENIMNIADTFSHLYERFCKIPVFKENRHFIMKTITEPILGVKA